MLSQSGYFNFWSNSDCKVKHYSNILVLVVYIIFVTLNCLLTKTFVTEMFITSSMYSCGFIVVTTILLNV